MCKHCGNPLCPEPDDIELVGVLCFTCGAPVVVNILADPPQACPACNGQVHQVHKINVHDLMIKLFNNPGVNNARWN